MTRTVECVVWCKKCRAEKYTVYRVPTQNKDVYEHKAEPGFAKHCNECGAVLERKPA